MKLLKQKGSGEIYVWSKELAARDDMEDFVKEVPVETVQVEQADQEEVVVEEVAEVEAAPVAKKKGKK